VKFRGRNADEDPGRRIPGAEMIPRAQRSDHSEIVEIVVVDPRPLFGHGVAAAFDPGAVRVLVLPPEGIAGVPASFHIALVALVVPDVPAVVGWLVRKGCRVIVYGAADGSSLPAAVGAGAAGFVSDRAGAAEMRDAVEAVARGATAVFPDHAGHPFGASELRFTRLGFAALTRREREVLDGLVAGMRPADIARRDFVSVVTVRNQVQSVLTKLNVHSQLEAAAVARWWGWSLDAAGPLAAVGVSVIDVSAS